MTKKSITKVNSKKIFLRNLPSSTLSVDLETHFSDIGPIKRAYVLTKPGSTQCIGSGVVHFVLEKDAQTALKQVKSAPFKGARIIATNARRRKPRPKIKAPQKDNTEGEASDSDYDIETKGLPSSPNPISPSLPPVQILDIVEPLLNVRKKLGGRGIGIIRLSSDEQVRSAAKRLTSFPGFQSIHGFLRSEQVLVAFFQSEEDASKAASILDGFRFFDPTLEKARLVVRNLPFSCTESHLRTAFCAHGDIIEIELVRKPSGEFKGVAFIQFKSEQQAQAARNSMNGKQVLKRKCFVNLAVTKDKYHETGVSPSIPAHTPVTHTPTTETLTKPKLVQRPAIFSKEEERKYMLFILNIPFECSEQEVEDLFKEFGSIKFCKLVRDKLTEQPRGTGFVCFNEKEAVHTLLLQAYPEIICDDVASDLDLSTCELPSKESTILCRDSYLIFRRVLGKENIQERENGKEREGKGDKRNLHLLKIGQISQEEMKQLGMSRGDIIKRMNWYKERKQKLINPLNFVSLDRVSVRNLPFSLDEKELKSKVLRIFDPKEIKRRKIIVQTKIVREKQRIDQSTLLPRSKGFGFIQFAKHEDGLFCIEKLNNSEEWFGPERRPIFEFSIENVQALKKLKMIQNFGRIKKFSEEKKPMTHAPYSGKQTNKNSKTPAPYSGKQTYKNSKTPAPYSGKQTYKNSKTPAPYSGKQTYKNSKSPAPYSGKQTNKNSKTPAPYSGKQTNKNSKTPAHSGKQINKKRKTPAPHSGKQINKKQKTIHSAQ